MGKEENRQTCNLISMIIVLSLVCLCMYGILGVYGFSLFPDEFGYWASAARALGYDFSEVASMGSYYSYGYSLILIPLLSVFKDSVICYRAAVVVNLVLQILSFFIMIRILDDLAKGIKRPVRIILAGSAVLYPSWVFYTQMTMSEALLFFLYTLIIFIMIRFLKEPSVLKGIILALCTVYIYTVHMRTVGVALSVFIMLMIKLIRGKDRERAACIVSAALLALGFVLALFAKDIVQGLLYNSGPVIRTSVNDYSGQSGKLIEILTPKGFARFFVSMSGKILYLGCATFGTAFVGIYSLFRKMLKKDENAFFILMTSAFQFLVMCVYLLHSADPGEKRFDLFVHGRYFDFAIPLLGVLGIYAFLENEECRKTIVFSSVLTALSSVIAVLIVSLNRTGMSDPHGMLMIGMSYFLDLDDYRPVRTIILSVLFSFAGAAVLIFLVSIYHRKHNAYVLLCIPLMLVVLGYSACNHFIYVCQSYIYGDIQVADKITDLRISGFGGDIILLYEGGLEYIDTVQFRLRDEHIKVYYPGKDISDHPDALKRYISEIPQKAIVLTDFESSINLSLDESYNSSWEAGHFCIHYNRPDGDL